MLLTLALTTSWHVWSGADPNILQAREEKDDIEDRVGNAIEMAILGKAKKFIKSSSCQKVIEAIWTYVSWFGSRNLYSHYIIVENMCIKLRALTPSCLTYIMSSLS
jgi:hypothetical protein